MKVYGVQLSEGSNISNLTVAQGLVFPNNPNDAELFYRNDADESIKGLYLYRLGTWERSLTTQSSIIQSGTVLPVPAVTNTIFYIGTGAVIAQGLYFAINTTDWVLFSSSAQDLQNATDAAIAMAIALG